ncbi:MAG: methyltransferase domain-containing protein [Pseudomonadota bacterium]
MSSLTVSAPALSLSARPPGVYNRLASRYATMHQRWLRHAGGPAQAAFEAAVVARLAAGDRMLDAGCGRGDLARHVLSARPGVVVTLLDACAEMLAAARDLPVPGIEGSLLDLPFPSASFDLVSAAWSIEATENPVQAIGELTRVLRPGGDLVLVFCSDAPPGSVAARILRRTVELRGTGRFLCAETVANALHAGAPGRLTHLRSFGPATALLFERGPADVQRQRVPSARP